MIYRTTTLMYRRERTSWHKYLESGWVFLEMGLHLMHPRKNDCECQVGNLAPVIAAGQRLVGQRNALPLCV